MRLSIERRTRTRLVRGFLAAIVVATLSGCAVTHAAGPKVLLVGDSLLNGSRSEVTSALSAVGWQPTIEAKGGTTITYWSTRVQFFQAFDQPDLVVIELGTNDCSPVECVDLAPYIDRIMRSIPTSHPVVWLNAQVDVPPLFAAHRDFVNNAIQAAKIRWPNLSVVDLSGHFADHPEWHNPDGLHFNAAGRQEFARFLVDALADHAPT